MNIADNRDIDYAKFTFSSLFQKSFKHKFLSWFAHSFEPSFQVMGEGWLFWVLKVKGGSKFSEFREDFLSCRGYIFQGVWILINEMYSPVFENYKFSKFFPAAAHFSKFL